PPMHGLAAPPCRQSDQPQDQHPYKHIFHAPWCSIRTSPNLTWKNCAHRALLVLVVTTAGPSVVSAADDVRSLQPHGSRGREVYYHRFTIRHRLHACMQMALVLIDTWLATCELLRG